MRCQTCECELTQAETNRAPDILPGDGPLCFECADWLAIETRTDNTITLLFAGEISHHREFSRNPK